MKKSLDTSFWNRVYRFKAEAKAKEDKDRIIAPKRTRTIFKKILRFIFRKNVKWFKENYGDYLFWEIIKRHLPRDGNLKIIEAGSAPGHNLVKMRNIFGYTPYGVELSEEGLLLNRRLFEKNDLPPDNVILEDFLSSDFRDRHSNFFDLSFSLGLIEHFDNPALAVSRHVDIIKKGGYLVITIPNFRGLNYWLLRFFNPSHLSIHNLSIMDKDRFKGLFDPKKLDMLECRYYGSFNFALFYPEHGSLKRVILKRIAKPLLQPLLNFIFFTLRKFNINLEHKYFSPYIIYIGQKRDRDVDIQKQSKI